MNRSAAPLTSNYERDTVDRSTITYKGVTLAHTHNAHSAKDNPPNNEIYR